MFVFTANADIFSMDIIEVWKRVKNLCKKNGITQQELSEKLGYGSRNLEVKIARKSIPSLEEVCNIAKIFNVTYDYLIEGIGEEENSKKKFIVPLLNQTEEKTEKSGYMELPENLKQYGEKLVMVYVNGDSMMQVLNRGDIVICDSCGYNGEGIYAVNHEGETFVRRAYKDSGSYILKPENRAYPGKEFPVDSEKSSIIGRVHYIIKNCD